ncbi:MAG: saccharopine dehydrogenase NADP-binding domain-containing protein [Oceanospirillaceae bacterium]|nr:saccharopine dehydrogenase NADP-binding domain-containing protein [Oceanospirillaceae bacterium]
MSNDRNVLIYGASGYTGKLVAESLAQRNIPFYMAGRTQSKLEAALKIVEERHGAPVDAEIVAASNAIEELLPLFEKVDVVINVSGPFMQLGWPIVEACLQKNCHYLDTTGEQDWTIAIQEKYGQAFADKGLLLSPANSYMWAAGALAGEVVLETKGIDSLDFVYQIDNALPSQASTKSFLRMQGNPDSQYYLEQGEYKAWPHDKAFTVTVPYRSQPLLALSWGGACEPVWFKMDDRVLNCRVLTAFGDEIVTNVINVIKQYSEQSVGMTDSQKEELTNQMGDEMTTAEPPKDSRDLHHTVIVCRGQGRQVTKSFELSLCAPYTWTGEICAEGAARILNGQLKAVGFQSAAKAFGHHELLNTFHELGFCSLPE